MTFLKSDRTKIGYQHRIHRAKRKKIYKKGIEIRATHKRRREALIIKDYEKEIKNLIKTKTYA